MINIGIDYHDTFTYNSQYFIELINNWKYKKYIISGTPERDKKIIEEKLKDFHIYDKIDGLLVGFDFDKKNMNKDHFLKMANHKLSLIKRYDISIYYDDNPFYVSYLRNHNITVFQTIISDSYIKEYENKDPFFSSHFQKSQFAFLDKMK